VRKRQRKGGTYARTPPTLRLVTSVVVSSYLRVVGADEVWRKVRP
jgi:hypothetical protein